MISTVLGGRSGKSFTPRANVVAIVILLVCAGAGLGIFVGNPDLLILSIVLVAVGIVLMQAPKVATPWERAIVLRLGRFVGLRGPGLFWIIPFIDRISSWIDQRTVTTSFAAEQTLTSDTVPVNVDAVLFWMVHDAEKAALEVQDYEQAISWAAQTALRDIIGRTALADLLRGREAIEAELQKLIDHRSSPWGVTVSSVEMRDIVIPVALQDAMSREAQAAREKQARIILGQAEQEIAHSFAEAAKSYHDNPTALHLRAMNMLYEGLKEKGALMLIPSSAVESMGMGGLMGAAALRQANLAGGDGIQRSDAEGDTTRTTGYLEEGFMVHATQILERFRVALLLMAVTAVLYGAFGLFTSTLGGFVLPALIGGGLLAVVLIRWNRTHPARAAIADPFARDAYSTDSVNFAHVRVAGLGGAGLLVVAALVALQYDLTTWAVAAGLAGGLAGAVVLIAYRRRW